MRSLFCLVVVATLSAGCSTYDGPTLHKKPDLSAVVAGTPIDKVRSLKRPTAKERITKGKLKGSEVWAYEWDLPDDDVYNRMYTYVIVQDGKIVDYVEEQPDKWAKNPKLYKDAKLASAWQGYMHYSARAQMYANMADSFNAMGATYRQPSTTSSQSSLNNALFASILDQQQQSQTQARNSPRTTTLTGPRGNYLGSISPTGMVLDGRGNYRGSVSDSGMLTGASGQYLGSVSRSGAMTDARGNYRGTVGPGGAISDSQGRYRGTISGGTVTDDKGRSVLFYSQ